MAAPTPREKSLALVSRIVTALDDKKAADIRVIDVSEQSGVTDFFVIATGAADQHLRGLRMEIDRVLDEDKVRIIGVESQPESGWTVVDAFDVIVHLFRADQRNNYQFEKLWKDGKELPAKQFIKGVARVLPDQAVLLTGNSKTPAEKKSAAKKAAAKVAAGKKAPVVKPSVAAKLSGAAKAAKKAVKAAAKVVETESDETPAKKAKVKQRPATTAEKKIIAKKEAKAAKTTRAKAKAKAKPSPLAKIPAKAKAGVITRKAKRA